MAPSTLEGKPRPVCKFFRAGNCRYGASCWFLHNNPSGAPPSAFTTTRPVQDVMINSENIVKTIRRKVKPCHAWKAGNCKWGDQCHFLHETKGPQGAQSMSSLDGDSGQSRPTMQDVLPAETGVSLTSHRKQADQGIGMDNDGPTLSSSAINQADSDYILRPIRERVEAVRLAKEREEAVRKAQEEGATRRALQEATRLAEERTAARERQLQLAKEREEAKERERVAQRHKQEEEWGKESAMTVQQVVFNSFAKFEAGLNIQHVICGFEASQILIKNLPMDAKNQEIIGLFMQQGIAEEDIAVLRIENVDGSQQATVLGKATDIETIAIGLDGIEFRDRNLEFVVCERLSGGRTMGSSSRNTYHLTISWRPAFLTMLARYPHLETWELHQKALELDRKDLNGQRVRAAYHWELGAERQGRNPFYDDYIGRSENQACIKISRVPYTTTVDMVRAFAETLTVETYEDPTSYSTSDVMTTLDIHIRGSAGSALRSLTLENNTRPNSISARAIFDSWEGAKSGYDSLNGKVLLANFPSLRLFLSDPYYFVITIDEKQYNAQRSHWIDLGSVKGKDAAVLTKTVDKSGRKKVVITLRGRDKKVVGALKVRIESMAAGQRLDAAYWHPTFKFGKGQSFLDGLYDATGAYVRCDWKNNCVSVFGRPEAVENAKNHIKDEVERISSEQWTIPLQRRALGFFVRKGLAQMQGLLGEENVTLDVGSAKIVLHGADLEEARHHLKQLMDAFLDHDSGSTVTSGDILCPICFDTVSQPIEISCEHIYCSSCLRHYILSTLDNHNFPLKCMGNEATCDKPLSVPLIRRFLPPKRFEQLLEAAFTTYLDKNPETFKYCKTPDCSQVYRATAEQRELQCPSCFSEVCTACHDEGHAGMTCIEKRQHKDPEEQERLLEAWAEENNVKRCPSCRTYVEKTEGCNHMSCKCGVHFCWICSRAFARDHIYNHMTEAHGDWYNDPGHDRVRARDQIPNIIEIAGGQAAVAEQAAELRRFELLRENRPARPVVPPVNNPFRAAPQLARPAAQPAWIGIYEEQQRRLQQVQREREAAEEAERQRRLREAGEQQRRQREADERRRRAVEEYGELRRQLQEREEQRQRQAREAAERRRCKEENKGWCIIM